MSHVEIHTAGDKLVDPLIDNQHLSECFKVTRTAPRLLHGFNVLRFRDRGTEPIRHSEGLDETVIMDERVLVQE